MPYQDDKFGHKAYDYKPTWEKDIDYSPERRPSDARLAIVDDDTNHTVRAAMEIRGEGALVFKAHANEQGQWVFDGVAIFTDDQIQFDTRA
jgi:mannose-6-phosphate isomerase-like protein (cupin superfamily)